MTVRCPRLAVLAGLFLLTGSLRAVPAPAEIVFEQLPTQSGFYSDFKAHPSFGFQVEGDSFVLAAASRVSQVEWWGDVDSAYFDAFRIRFFTDDGGLPGALLHDATYTEVVGLADGDFRRYLVVLPEVPELDFAGGATYWMSIAGANAFTGAPDAGEIFYWSAGDVLGYARQLVLDGSWLAANFKQPAFRLSGEPLTPVAASTLTSVKTLFR